MYILIEHCNGHIMGHPFIIYNESELKPFINGEYLIYNLDDYYTACIENAMVSVLQKYEEF